MLKHLLLNIIVRNIAQLTFSFLCMWLLQNEIENGRIIFSEHLHLSKLQQGIKSGLYLQGTFRANRDNYLEATVWVHGDGDEKEVCLVNLGILNWEKISQVLIVDNVL